MFECVFQHGVSCMCDSIAAQSLVKTVAAAMMIVPGIAAVTLPGRAATIVASLECPMPLEFIMETHV